MADDVIDDQALFDNAVSGTEPAIDTPVDVVVEQPRDETGKFAQKVVPVVDPVVTPAVTPKVEATPQSDSIPPWRLKEEADARREAERRASDFERRLAAFEQKQPKPEPVDFFANPDEAIQQRLTPIEQQYSSLASELRMTASETRDIAIHGQKAHDELQGWIETEMKSGNPAMRQIALDMTRSRDPVSVARNHFKRESMLKETGGDLTAYRQKLRDEALNDPEFLSQAAEKLKGAAAKNPIARTITPLPSITRVGATALPEGQDEVSDAELFNSTTTRRKRA